MHVQLQVSMVPTEGWKHNISCISCMGDQGVKFNLFQAQGRKWHCWRNSTSMLTPSEEQNQSGFRNLTRTCIPSFLPTKACSKGAHLVCRNQSFYSTALKHQVLQYNCTIWFSSCQFGKLVAGGLSSGSPGNNRGGSKKRSPIFSFTACIE